ncbi:Short transient receptor potential channel [Trichinella spiralis]|uniref:Short transient receptor potential channel n=1 Tax=Trichinella spiralis TaxID=6334 RepID=A0ABR3KWX9_TRISP
MLFSVNFKQFLFFLNLCNILLNEGDTCIKHEQCVDSDAVCVKRHCVAAEAMGIQCHTAAKCRKPKDGLINNSRFCKNHECYQLKRISNSSYSRHRILVKPKRSVDLEKFANLNYALNQLTFCGKMRLTEKV